MSPIAASAIRPSFPRILYLAECSYGRHGIAFRETDRDSNSRSAVIELIRTGEIEVVKVLEIDESEGSVRDVTDELVNEASDMRVAA